MLIVAALLLIILWVSARGVRTAGAGPRWPFLGAAVLSGGAALALVLTTVVALIAGRDTWNGWVGGSQSSETITLWLLLVAGPALLLTCCGLLLLGVVLRARQRRHSPHASSR